MKYFYSILFCIIGGFQVLAQDIVENLEGKVSYKSSQNVYVKFTSTENIQIGDTLYIMQENHLIPVLLVKYTSSISCVGIPISDLILQISDRIIAKSQKNIKINYSDTLPEIEESLSIVIKPSPERTRKKVEETKTKQQIRGRLSAASYANFSNTSAENTQRMRYVFSMRVTNLANSNFSIENYISFRHTINHWDEVKENINDALKIYNLAINYNVDKNLTVSLGRKINPKISNIGAIDGLQVEKRFHNFFVGAMVGSRPDHKDYSKNTDLFQYGGYIGYSKESKKGYSQTTLGILEQKNNGYTDRRFVYFQHSSLILKNLTLFGSFELDMYQLKEELVSNAMRPTSIFVSLRYRPIKNLSLSASYDARNNVIYYESYKNFIDRLIETETRQGLRLRINFRPIKYVSLGASGGYRYQNQGSASKNLYSYLSFSRIPWIKSSATISRTFLHTSYLTGSIYGIRMNKDFAKGKFYGSLNYRLVHYSYSASDISLDQTIGGASVTWRILKKLSMGLFYEGTFDHEKRYTRIYANITQRF